MAIQSIQNQILRTQQRIAMLNAQVMSLQAQLNSPCLTYPQRNRIMLRIQSCKQQIMNQQQRVNNLAARLQAAYRDQQIKINQAAFTAGFNASIPRRRRYY